MEWARRNAPVLLLAAALAAAAVLILALAAGLTYFQDTWAFLIERRDPSARNFFYPHNEHIVLVPVLIEQALLRLFGMTSAMPEYVLLTIGLLANATLLFAYMRRRVGEWLALFGAVLLLFLGPAWEVLLWPFEIGFVGSIFFGLAMLLALDREDDRGDLAACVFLIAAFGFATLGLPFAAGAAVAIALGPRERWLRRAYVVVIPVALYGLWYLTWGNEAVSHVSIRNALDAPPYVLDAVSSALGSMVGLAAEPGEDLVWGRIVLVLVVVGVVLWRWRRPHLDRSFWTVAAVAGANWFLTALNQFPGREATASRYQYMGAVLILLLLANLLRDVRLCRRGLALAAVAVGLAVAPNLVTLKDGARFLEEQTVLTRADTAAIEIARESVDPSFQLSPEVAGTASLINIYAGPYLEAVDEYGSPAYSEAELLAADPDGRRQADVVLAQALPLSTVTETGNYRAAAPAGPQCVELPAGEKPEVQLGPGESTIVLAPGPAASFDLRRFAGEEFPVPTEGAPGASTTTLTIPPDRSPQPWFVRVEAEQPAHVCPPAG